MITKQKFETLKQAFLESCLRDMYPLVEHYRQDVHFIFYDGKFSVYATTQKRSWDIGVYYIKTVEDFYVNDNYYGDFQDNDYISETLIEAITTSNPDALFSLGGADHNLFEKLELESLRNRIAKLKTEYDPSSEVQTRDIMEVLMEDKNFCEFYSDWIRTSYIEDLNYEYDYVLEDIENLEYKEVKEWMKKNG